MPELEEMNLMFADLTAEAQDRVLEFFNIKTAADGNYDIIPLCVLAYEPDDKTEKGEVR